MISFKDFNRTCCSINEGVQASAISDVAYKYLSQKNADTEGNILNPDYDSVTAVRQIPGIVSNYGIESGMVYTETCIPTILGVFTTGAGDNEIADFIKGFENVKLLAVKENPSYKCANFVFNVPTGYDAMEKMILSAANAENTDGTASAVMVLNIVWWYYNMDRNIMKRLKADSFFMRVLGRLLVSDDEAWDNGEDDNERDAYIKEIIRDTVTDWVNTMFSPFFVEGTYDSDVAWWKKATAGNCLYTSKIYTTISDFVKELKALTH